MGNLGYVGAGGAAGLNASLEDMIAERYKKQQDRQRQEQIAIENEMKRRTIAQADRRIGIDETEATSRAKLQQATLDSIQQTRDETSADKLSATLMPGSTLDPGSAATLQKGNRGALVQHDAAELPSRAMSGAVTATEKAPTAAPMRVISAGRLARDTFKGTAGQQRTQQFLNNPNLSPEARLAIEYEDVTGKNPPAALVKPSAPETQPVMRVNPRTGQMEQIGSAPKGAHFVNEPAPPSATQRGELTPTAEANLTTKLAKDWQKVSEASREMDRQYNLMETGMKRFREGDKNGGAQAVLVTFQKILDPTSVVRESEYARSAAGVSLLQRMQGYAEKLASGGAGVPDAALQEMVKTAHDFLANSKRGTDGQRNRLKAFADKYKIPHELVFDDMPPAAGGTAAAPAAGPKVVRYDMSGNPIKD